MGGPGQWPQSQRLPSVTHYTSWIQIQQCVLGPPTQASTCPGPSEVCQIPSGWSRGGMGEGHVVRWDQNITFWNKLHSPCLEEEEGCVQSQEHHLNCEAWGWKHHALGVLFCKGDRTTAPYWLHRTGSSSMTMTPNTQQGQLRSAP